MKIQNGSNAMKYCGRLGYVTTVEIRPGYFDEKAIERRYRGDVIKLSSRREPMEYSTNENITINNQISIVADPFAYQHFSSIRYVEFMGVFWEVTSIEVSRPRLILTIGGPYNGRRPDDV